MLAAQRSRCRQVMSLEIAHTAQKIRQVGLIRREHDRGGDDRTRPGAAAGFVQPGDQARSGVPQLLFVEEVGPGGRVSVQGHTGRGRHTNGCAAGR